RGEEPNGKRSGFSRVLANARQGLGGARDRRSLGASLAASLLGWTTESGGTMLALMALGIHPPLSAPGFVPGAADLAPPFPFAPPGNLGTLEVGATLGLMAFGVSKAHALAFSLCYHALQLVPVTLLGALVAGREAWVAPPGHGGFRSPRRAETAR